MYVVYASILPFVTGTTTGIGCRGSRAPQVARRKKTDGSSSDRMLVHTYHYNIYEEDTQGGYHGQKAFKIGININSMIPGIF